MNWQMLVWPRRRSGSPRGRPPSRALRMCSRELLCVAPSRRCCRGRQGTGPQLVQQGGQLRVLPIAPSHPRTHLLHYEGCLRVTLPFPLVEHSECLRHLTTDVGPRVRPNRAADRPQVSNLQRSSTHGRDRPSLGPSERRCAGQGPRRYSARSRVPACEPHPLGKLVGQQRWTLLPHILSRCPHRRGMTR